MRIAIIGVGYVGLVSGACLADAGHHVACADSDAEVIALIDQGEIPVFEPGLAALVARNRQAGRLSFGSDITAAVTGADIVCIAVETPARRGDRNADLSLVWEAAELMAGALPQGCVIAIKSTVPVGTADEVEQFIRELQPSLDFAVVSNPEFCREGAGLHDFRHPDRIVIGSSDARAGAAMAALYAPLGLSETPLLMTSRRTAELIKYSVNAFLATKITFINEIADLCEKAGADVQDVASGMGLDRRIGAQFLEAGPGFGGSSFPKDLRALVQTSHDFGAPFEIVETVMRVNDERKQVMAERVLDACGGTVKDMTIAVLGLAFKGDTDDMRDAPSVPLIQKLQQSGATIRAFDPAAMGQASDILHSVDYAADAYGCAEGADVIVIVTDWPVFRTLDLARLHARCNDDPIMVDLRNLFTPAAVAKHGFRYFSIGRAVAKPA